MSFSIIAAIGKNRELGKDGRLLWRLPEDLKYFKKTTMGHPVLMGHKTFDSLPGLLPGRKHYVVTRRADLDLGPGVEIINNLPAFLDKHSSDTPEEIFVIGGGMIYWEMLKHCDKLYLTEVDAVDDQADTFFPDFDKSKFEKEIVGRGTEGDIEYAFAVYTRKNNNRGNLS